MDFLEPGYGPGCLAWIGDSFAMFSVNEIEEEDPERRALINRCMRLLLEAGADPSSNQLHEGCGCFVDDVLDVGTAVLKKTFQLWNTTANRNEGVTTDAS